MNRNTPVVTVADLTWPEVQERLDNGCKIAILPFGHTEQHGPHLPMGADTYYITEITRRGAELAMQESGKPTALVFPTLPFGNGGKFSNGELRLSPSIFITVIVDLMKELEEQGFTKVILASGHGGNPPVLGSGVNEAYRLGIKIDGYIVSPFAFMWDAIEKLVEGREYGHACEVETATSLHLFPELVHMERIPNDTAQPEFWLQDEKVKAVKDDIVTHYWPNARQVSLDNMPGYVGEPKKASKEKGEKLVNTWVRGFADFLIDLDNH